MGRDAGLAVSAYDVARSGTVVGSAGVGTGVGIGRAGGVGTSSDAGVNTVGGSKRANVVKPNSSVNTPVHDDAHFESRENSSMGGIISGSQGGPIVVKTVPLTAVLLPKPHVGQARSLISSGAIPPA